MSSPPPCMSIRSTSFGVGSSHQTDANRIHFGSGEKARLTPSTWTKIQTLIRFLFLFFLSVCGEKRWNSFGPHIQHFNDIACETVLFVADRRYKWRRLFSIRYSVFTQRASTNVCKACLGACPCPVVQSSSCSTTWIFFCLEIPGLILRCWTFCGLQNPNK